MTDPETPSQPLLAAPTQQAAVNAQGSRSSRTYKVAGLTLLACVLIVGQVMIAYFLLSQRNDIKSLKEQNSNLESELTKGRSAAVPMPMRRPVNALPVIMDTLEEDSSTGIPEKTVPLPATACQLQAAGVKPVQPPGFRPDCDEKGRYRAQQCFMRTCWCVIPATGELIPGSVTNGAARCNTLPTGAMSKLPVSDVLK